jgi:hypothetical protein
MIMVANLRAPATDTSGLRTNIRKRLRAQFEIRDGNRHPLLEGRYPNKGRPWPGVRITRRMVSCLIVGLLSATALIARPGTASAAIPGHIADAAISSCPATEATVPSDYLGLSMEWSMVKVWVGTSRTSVIAPFVNILDSLDASPATPGVLRVGGNSQDGYQWNATGSTTANSLFSGTINSGLVDALLEAARRTGWKVIMGLNLRNDDPAMATALAGYAISQDTGHNLLALELGNEPNGYLSEADYLARFQRYAAALAADPGTAGALTTCPTCKARRPG